MNLIILNNRIAIDHYLVALRAVVADCSANLKTYYDKFGINWNEARYKFTFSEFSKQIQTALDVNLVALFEKHSKIFENLVAMQEKAV